MIGRMNRRKFLACALAALGIWAVSFAAQATKDPGFRRICVARHGHRPGGSGDPALLPLGVEQARLLGERLKSIGFSGNIYASPYLRTVQTAAEAAKVLGVQVRLEPRIQEGTHIPGLPDAVGLTQAQLEERFPGLIAPEPALKHPWVLTDNIGKLLEKRVETAIDTLLETTKGDLLLVGHKPTVKAALKILSARAKVETRINIWNCTLIYFIVDREGRTHFVSAGTDFLPPEQITDNFRPGLLDEKPADAPKD